MYMYIHTWLSVYMDMGSRAQKSSFMIISLLDKLLVRKNKIFFTFTYQRHTRSDSLSGSHVILFISAHYYNWIAMHERGFRWQKFSKDLQLLVRVAKRFALFIAASEVSVLFEITYFKEQFRVHRFSSLGYLVP